MNISKADVAMLGRRQEQPERRDRELVAIFVRGKLVNTKNARLFWKSESNYKRGWRDRVAEVLLETGWRQGKYGPHTATTAKRITFLCNVHGLMDAHDGLRVACAPIVDALRDAGIIHSDAHDCGHEFLYEQRIDRAHRGVEIRVRLRHAPAASAARGPGAALGPPRGHAKPWVAKGAGEANV